MTLYSDIGDATIDTGPEVFRVMIVDDSAFIRGAIARAIESDEALRVVSSIPNGEQAISSLRREPVDVIVLDIEMPVMDGLTALPKLKDIDGGVQIIMASTLTQKNAEISLKAMSLGATDYIPKPSSGHEVNAAEDFRRELVAKVKALGSLARRSGVRPVVRPFPTSDKKPLSEQEKAHIKVSQDVARKSQERLVLAHPLGAAAKRPIILRTEPITKPQVIAIGSSTGGPQALFKVIKEMGSGLPQPIVITQHMPPSFTTILAEHITKQCGVVCQEARDGERLVAGRYYIAPGDYHMVLKGTAGNVAIKLNQDPPENFCRPSVDPMVRSLAPIFGRNVLVVILTGMGADGTRSCELIVQNGGSVIAQDEATSVVWGMPGSVATAGLCSAVLPVAEIGGFVRKTALGMRA
ncbi:MAG: chemotaxis response regulator protein-glutamate methylesterase [Alphaproteobacteria bacterium]|jgi:two-component system chemotaxis response regulator CheB|nr:chemotaxis response regulator protein-glutamate methylesterase [Alphaproteobacteria bacterium]